MSEEAPKRIWLINDHPFISLNKNHADNEEEYIRADIAEEMRDKLEMAAKVFRTYELYYKYRDAFDKAERNREYAEQMEAALKLMEES